jgi:hypothetical protein
MTGGGYDFTINRYGPKVTTAASVPNLADPDPDRTFLGLLSRELMTATEREKETRAALQEHQAKADHLTREREAIERAIKAYQGQTTDPLFTPMTPEEARRCDT